LFVCFCSSSRAVKILVLVSSGFPLWNLYGSATIGQKENVKLPIAVRGSTTSVLKFPIDGSVSKAKISKNEMGTNDKRTFGLLSCKEKVSIYNELQQISEVNDY